MQSAAGILWRMYTFLDYPGLEGWCHDSGLWAGMRELSNLAHILGGFADDPSCTEVSEHLHKTPNVM
jgi:hypothetical protein